MKPRSVLAAAVGLSALAAASASAQNSAEPPVVVSPPPAETPAPPPPPPPPPPASTDVAPAPGVVVPQSAPPPPEPVTISPDVAYPNGFADPADPFANDMSLAYRQESGFDWGLLGLLGLLGLIPLFRDRGGTVHRRRVEYEDEPRRVVRRDRVEERDYDRDRDV